MGEPLASASALSTKIENFQDDAATLLAVAAQTVMSYISIFLIKGTF